MSPRCVTDPHAMAFAAMYGLQPATAAILAEMYRGEWIAALRSRICVLRQSLEPEAIDTADGRYRLTEAGKSECQAVLGEFAKWFNGEAA